MSYFKDTTVNIVGNTTAALENSDNILSKYIEKLDSEFTTQKVRVKILCRDYPHEYKNNYMPNLLKLSPGEYSETVLLADMDLVLDHYKQTSNSNVRRFFLLKYRPTTLGSRPTMARPVITK